MALASSEATSLSDAMERKDLNRRRGADIWMVEVGDLILYHETFIFCEISELTSHEHC
jgi:hypothetical protein